MEWQVKQLGDVCNIIGGGTPSKSNDSFYEGEIPWATVRDMRNERLSSTELYITEEAIKQSSTNLIPSGTIVTATRVGLGKVCILEQDTAINQDLKAIIPKTKELDSLFLYWWMKSIAHLIIEAGTGATVQGVKLTFVNALEVPLPPIPEQKRIVALLDTVFADLEQTRAKTEQNLRNARELMNVTFHNAIKGKLTQSWRESNKSVVTASESLRKLKEKKTKLVSEKNISKEKLLPELSKEEVPYELPTSWMWCRLGEIGNAISFPFVDGPFGSSINTKTDYIESGVPVLRMVNVKPFTFKNYNLKYVNEDKYQQFTRHNVLSGDVLFSKVGAGTGESCVVPDDFSYGMLSTTGITRIRVGEVVRNQYLCCFLNSNIKSFMTLASKAAQPFLNMTQIKTFPFPLPPTEEQSEIVLILEKLSTEIEQVEAIYEKKLLALDELKKSILQKAFSGELTNAVE